MRLRILCQTLAAVAAITGALAAQATVAPRNWHDAKCTRYKQAWSDALARAGTRGLGQEFLARHAAFLASNCTRRSDVCPRSQEELRLANAMVIRSMNFGAASTFVPFYCR